MNHRRNETPLLRACHVEQLSRWAPHYHSQQHDRVAPSSLDSALAASFIIFALFALASRATSTSRRWRHVSRHRRDAPRRRRVDVHEATVSFGDFPPTLVDDILASDDGPVVLQCAGGLMVEHPLLRPHVRGCVETEPVS